MTKRHQAILDVLERTQTWLSSREMADALRRGRHHTSNDLGYLFKARRIQRGKICCVTGAYAYAALGVPPAPKRIDVEPDPPPIYGQIAMIHRAAKSPVPTSEIDRIYLRWQAEWILEVEVADAPTKGLARQIIRRIDDVR